MSYFKSLKNQAALTAIFMLSSAFADLPLGLLGGQIGNSTGPAYASFLSTSGIVTPLSGLPSNCQIETVDMNVFGQGIIGGGEMIFTGPVFAALISPSGMVTPVPGLPSNGYLYNVAINNLGQGIIGGQLLSLAGPAYTALISPAGIATPISTSITVDGFILGVGINDMGQGLIGGRNITTGAPYAAVVSPSGIATEITGLPTSGNVFDVAINASSHGLIGGKNLSSGAAFAALVSPSGIATPIPGLPSLGQIVSTAINDSGQGIIGGEIGTNFSGPFYAALVSPSGIATSIPGLPSNGICFSVAINSSGQGIMGGQAVSLLGPAYAALVSPSGILTPINLGIASGAINSVAINDFGQGLIGGEYLNTSAPFAAIVSPSGIATPLNLGFSSGSILSVAILNQIPTGSLSGNNLSFANYINQDAPQNAFYFAPAFFDGTLADALESAAPTRNAISLYTASNNLFYLTTGLSNHIRNRSRYMRKTTETYIAAAIAEPEGWLPEELTASILIHKPRLDECRKQCIEPVETCECPDEKTNTVWFEAIGAFAHQKEQHQTPGFDPSSGGLILAYDGKTSRHTRMGVGASYLYTHIHEDDKAGHSNINQEDLFVYGSWENKRFYFDGCLLGGLFQITQVRNIHMTGFDFKSKSKPNGWQLLPHAELGYHYTRSGGVELTINPFVMVDWANAWQKSFHEKGSGPFNAGQKSHYSSLLRTEASLRFYETIFFDSWNLIFQEKAGYVNVHSFRTGRVNAFLVGSPGAFTVTTLTGDQNLGVGEFAMIFAPHNSSMTTTIFYQGEFGSKYQSHQVALELAWNF